MPKAKAPPPDLKYRRVEVSGLRKGRRGISTTLVEGIMTETYKWHEVYKAALLETDWSKMEERIATAEAALHLRIDEFALNHGGTPEENQAIEDALNGLNVLRNDLAAWQGSRRAS
jgi:uncharacterized protein YecA (UPF0149 family)